MRLFVPLLPLFFLASCASTPKLDDGQSIAVKADDKSLISIVKSDLKTGQTSYTFQNQTGSAQWMSCSLGSGATVLIMHREQAGFEPKSFCNGWVAQAFLKHGFQVVAVNRPSYGSTTGFDDFSGPKSVEAIQAGLNAAQMPAIEGIWGYSAGAIAASYYAKQYGSAVKWMILGGGIYDLEVTERATTSEFLKASVATLKAKEGDAVFERRSISWDFTGLPKLIGLYHAQDDSLAPVSQANTFNNQLRVAEYKVYKNDIPSGGHDLPWRGHMSIVEQTLAQLVGPAKK